MKRSEYTNLLRQKVRQWLPEAGEREWGVTANGYGVWAGGQGVDDGTVLKLDLESEPSEYTKSH